MNHYILNKNKQPIDKGGNYELHNEDKCSHLPDLENRISVGYFSDCHQAMIEAKRRFPDQSSEIDGCYWQCHACHSE